MWYLVGYDTTWSETLSTCTFLTDTILVSYRILILFSYKNNNVILIL